MGSWASLGLWRKEAPLRSLRGCPRLRQTRSFTHTFHPLRPSFQNVRKFRTRKTSSTKPCFRGPVQAESEHGDDLQRLARRTGCFEHMPLFSLMVSKKKMEQFSIMCRPQRLSDFLGRIEFGQVGSTRTISRASSGRPRSCSFDSTSGITLDSFTIRFLN